MNFKADIGIIGAMADEVDGLISRLSGRKDDSSGGIVFHTGMLLGKNVVIAKCGIGKVFAALTAEAMILMYSPELIVNTGVGGAVRDGLCPCDVVVADRLVQHDMDTSPLGDPKGLVSGINVIYFNTDKRATDIILDVASRNGISSSLGTVATGDRFISSREEKQRLLADFNASACEMEGCAIAQVAYVNSTPFAVIRAISDSADGNASMDYPTFLLEAVKISSTLTLGLVENY
jgi:adenosylhomocysteine nucleosidase